MIVHDSPYIGHWFITTTIYDNNAKVIGYKATTAKARITSATGYYVNANGCVKLTPKADGHRDVVICYK